MKSLLTLFIILCGLTASAQQEIAIRNNTTMDLEFNFFIYETNSCTEIYNASITVLAGTSYTMPLLSAPEEYVWVEIGPLSCSGFGLTVGTPMACNSLCQNTLVSSFQTTNNCPGNPFNFVDARWIDCLGTNGGTLEVNEF